MNIQPFKYFRHDLICRIIAVFLFQTDVIPDHIIGVVEIPALQIFRFQIHRRQVIPVKYDDGRLSAFFQCRHEVSCKFVHLVDFIYIIFPRIAFALVLHAVHFDRRIFQGRLRRIITVPLHADRKHEILSLGRIHRIQDIRDQHVVGRPSFRRHPQDVHKLFACIMIESHMVEYLCTAVKITAVVVQRLRPISKGDKRRRRALDHFRLSIRLVRIFTRTEESHAHACQYFKLGIRGSGSDRRYFEISAGIFAVHFS